MNAQLTDAHYTILSAIHEQLPHGLFLEGDYNSPRMQWYTNKPGGSEIHALHFTDYAARRAFIAALESEGYFAQPSVTGTMFKYEPTRIPASVATIFKAPVQDDRAVRQNAQIHANLAIAYELAAYVMEAHSSMVNALYYRQCANAEIASIPLYLHREYRQQLSHALYINGYLR